MPASDRSHRHLDGARLRGRLWRADAVLRAAPRLELRGEVLRLLLGQDRPRGGGGRHALLGRAAAVAVLVVAPPEIAAQHLQRARREAVRRRLVQLVVVVELEEGGGRAGEAAGDRAGGDGDEALRLLKVPVRKG